MNKPDLIPFKNIFNWFLQRSRPYKRVVSLAVDFVLLFVACLLALMLHYGEALYAENMNAWLVSALAPVCVIPAMIPTGLYRAVIRYVGYHALWNVVKAVTFGTLFWLLIMYVAGIALPLAVTVIFWMTALLGIGGTRMLGRWMFRQLSPVGYSYKNRHANRVLIYGAGAFGHQMATAFINSSEVSPVGFLDDDKSIQGSELIGLRIYSPEHLPGLIERYGIDSVLLAIRSLTASRQRELVRTLENYPITVKVMPSLVDVDNQGIQYSDMSNIEVTDLLRRDSVQLNKQLLSSCVAGCSVMVTGAGGSIGSELCRQVLTLKPARLVLYELNEFALYSIERELRHMLSDAGQTLAAEDGENSTGKETYQPELVAILGNVQDQKQLERVITHFEVETLYHAAAYKHVPIVEQNIVAGIRNNLTGTLCAAEAAVNCKVRHFVLISTDKAVRPTNIMGASKRLAEMVLQAISARESAQASECQTRFAMVRFGNVLASSGSVVHVFRSQIEKGGPVTVTHPEITRYFMTIPEAASLVIQAGAMGKSGDLFLLDMGQPVRIAELAREMIRLSGRSVRDEYNPEGDIELIYTGLRPGEKLYEELLISADTLPTEHPMIMRAREDFISWQTLKEQLTILDLAMDQQDINRIREQLTQLVSGYQPDKSSVDLLSDTSHASASSDKGNTATAIHQVQVQQHNRRQNTHQTGSSRPETRSGLSATEAVADKTE